MSSRPLGGRGFDHCTCVVLRLAVLGCNRGISAYQADRSSLGLVFDRAGADIDGLAAKHNVLLGCRRRRSATARIDRRARCVVHLTVVGHWGLPDQAASGPEVVQSTKTLQQSREDSKAFAEVSSDFSWAMDDELRFTYFSEAFSRVTGVRPETLLGRTHWEVGAPGAEPEALQQHLRELN